MKPSLKVNISKLNWCSVIKSFYVYLHKRSVVVVSNTFDKESN